MLFPAPWVDRDKSNVILFLVKLRKDPSPVLPLLHLKEMLSDQDLFSVLPCLPLWPMLTLNALLPALKTKIMSNAQLYRLLCRREMLDVVLQLLIMKKMFSVPPCLPLWPMLTLNALLPALKTKIMSNAQLYRLLCRREMLDVVLQLLIMKKMFSVPPCLPLWPMLTLNVALVLPKMKKMSSVRPCLPL